MKTYITAILIFISGVLVAQKEVKIDYSDSKVQALAKEVYANEVQYLTKEHLAVYKDFLNRIEIRDISGEKSNNNYKLISTLTLVNKYNPELDYDKGPNFDIYTFNPLKYFFLTNENGGSDFYRIYQTNYVVRLVPVK